MRVPASLGWKAGLLLLALAIQSFAPQASVSVNAQAVPDVGVTAIELPAGPVNQGDTAEIKVTIENLGSATASVMVILNYLDAESTPGSVGQMMHDVPAGQTAEVSFSWDTTGVPLGSYTFQAVALSGENLDGEDGNHENNSLLSTEAVTIVAQAVPDVGVTAIQVPTDPVSQGDIIEIDVTVQNLGSATASVTVTLLDTTDPGQVAEKTEDIDADATKVVTLAWNTTDASLGNHTLRAVAVVEGDTNVDNDSLLSTEAVTIVAPVTYGVAVTAVEVASATVIQGATVNVDVTVKNQGTSDANAKVTLLYVSGEGQPGTAAEKTVAIAAGAAETVTLSWDTSGAALGAHTFRADVTLVEDTNVSDSRDSAATITISAPPPYAVAVTAVESASAVAIQGATVNVDVTVENQGTSDANAAVTLLYIPGEGQPGIAAEKTVAIAAGAAETVTLSWDTSGAAPGIYTIRAGATLVEDTNAADFRDAASAITISIPPPYAVAVTAVEAASATVIQGDTVNVDVTVENQGTSDANAAVTLLYVPAEGQPGIAAEKTVAIAAGAAETVTLAWDTSDAALGIYTIRAGATLVEDSTVADSLDAASTITISTPPPYAVAVTAVEVASATVIQGETVDVEVTVKNLGTSDANAKLTLLYVPAQGQPGIAAEKTVAIATGAAETVTLAWDTADAALGVYTIRAGATLVEDSNVAHSLDAASTITIVTPPPYAVAVTAVDVPAGPVIQGATVNVDVTLENQGTSDANAAVTLLYVPAEGEPGTAAEKTVAIAARAAETVTLSWDTSDSTPGVYTIRAGATLVEDTDVAHFLVSTTSVTISAPTYGVSITAFDVPSGPATQGYVVDADVTVKNLGSVAARFTVTLFDQPAGGTEGTADEETVEIAAAATKTVTLSWDTSDATPGAHTFRAGVTLVDDTDVSDSRDSAATITISPPPYAVAVTAVEVASATAIQGATVEVEVTVENQGTSDATAKITLLYVPAEGEPGTAAEKTVAIVAGAAETVTLSWDTSGTTLGAYTIRAGVTLVEDTSVADSLDGASTITISAPPPYAVAVTVVDVASATAIQGDTVDVEVTVENQGTSDANAEITLLYIPDQGQPGIAAAETAAIAAAATKTVTLSWDTSDATPGVYTIRAGATLVQDTDVADSRDAASTITIGALTYGVSITALDVPSGPATQGDVVDAYVTVKNLGSVAAMFTVTLFNQPAGGTEGTADKETVEIAADATKKVTLSWDTSGAAPGAHTFRAGVTLVEDANVSDSRDSAAIITISPPPYAVAITAVEVSSATVVQGATVDVEVTVKNQGALDATAAVTLLYVPAVGQPGIAAKKTVAIAAGAAETVTLSWDTSDATPGVYTIRAGVTLVEDANVSDFQDGAATITIVTPPPYAVAVTAVNVASSTVIQGETVDVEVTVKNLGTSDANAGITLRYVPAEGQPGTAAKKTVAIAAGAAETVTLSWDTSDSTPGVYTIRAVATLVDDTNVFDYRDAASTITISDPTYGVSITAFDVPSGPATQGYVVNADVTVKNLSSVAARFTVTLFDQPAGGLEGTADEETVEIAAGATKTVTLSWDTSDAAPGAHTFRAGVILVEDANVSDSRDSAATITISIPPPYAVAVTAVEVANATAIQGDTVDVDVTVENQGTSDANAAVTLFYRPVDGTEETADEKTVDIVAGSSETVTLSWDTSAATPGDYTITAGAILVEDTNVSDSWDALPTITISPPPYAVAVTAVEVASATATQGDTVDVDVTVENQGTFDANAKITLLHVPAEGEPGIAAEKTVAIAAGATETVTLSWDTSDAALGDYTIRAGVTLVEDTNAADSWDAVSTITINAPVTYGVAVTAVDVPDGPAALGAEVDVDVTIENLGNTKVKAEVTLLYVPAQGRPGIAAEKTVAIAAGASVTITLSWDTSGVTPGDHTMRAGVTLVEDTNAADFRDSTSTITVISGRIILGDDRGLGLPDASFGGTLAAAPVETTPSPVTRLLIFGGFAKGYKTSSPVIETSLVPHDKLFTTNAQATFGSGLQNPFELGEIRVTVHLEERPNSLGAYVMVGSQIFFADANGNCRIVVPSGVYDLAIQAPGYVSARIPGVRLGIGEAVTVPELTLPFGDSNGDGHIDILDLSIAAGNFGATMHQISLP